MAEVSPGLQGNWREEHLFTRKQALALIDACTAQITTRRRIMALFSPMPAVKTNPGMGNTTQR